MTAGSNSTYEPLISAGEAEKITEGSLEQFMTSIDHQINDNSHLFTESKDDGVFRMATFGDHVVLGTASGTCYKVPFSENDGKVRFDESEKLDVNLVSRSNKEDYIKECTMSAVDALLSGRLDEAKEQILDIAHLPEGEDGEDRDYISEINNALDQDVLWRDVYSKQYENIKEHLSDDLDRIISESLSPKYEALYKTEEIPEENFEDYRGPVTKDLNSVIERLATFGKSVVESYFPFQESVDSANKSEEETEVIESFKEFAEDLIGNLHEVVDIAAEAVDNEQCVMCLGQIYDSVAESVQEFEVAGNFVQRMIETFSEK